MWKGLFLFLALAGPASAEELRITFNPGGQIEEFLDTARDLRKTKTPIVVDGMCISACTILVDADASQACVTLNARLGFHQATSGDRFLGGTRFVVRYKTKGLDDWIAAQGGLPTNGILWMTYLDAIKFFRACPELTYSF